MPIPVTCSGCARRFTAPNSAAGKRGKCPKCHCSVVVPRPVETPDSRLLAVVDEVLGEEPRRVTEVSSIDIQPTPWDTASGTPAGRNSAAISTGRAPAEKVECPNCGAGQRVALTHEAQFLRCHRCDGMLIAPSKKAYDYQATQTRRSLLLAAAFVVAVSIALFFGFQHSSVYLKSPEGVAYLHVRSTAKLDLALAAANADLEVLCTLPRCVESRDERLFLFLYELYYRERPDLGRVKKYVVVENKDGAPKTLEITVGYPPPSW